MLRFMLQVLTVLGACRVVGWFGKRFLGQAHVTMEMITGIILGPSVFGSFIPNIQQSIFPQFLVTGNPASGKNPSMSVLYVVAQVGIILYMFLIGLDLDLSLIKSRSKEAISVSAAGIIFPFILGVAVFYTLLSSRSDMFGPSVPPTISALYVGAAKCVTAYPVLARIVYEAGIAGTPIGTLTISAGAANDVIAWALLAVILAITKGTPAIAIYAVGGSAIFSFILLTQKQKLLGFLDQMDNGEGLSQTTFGIILLLVFLCAWCTDMIGVHAIFGAFVLGVAIPKGRLGQLLRDRIEPLTVSFFLPFFFVYSGLNTKISSLASTEHWLIAGTLLLAAIAGKFLGCYFAARACGEPKRQSTAIGILMNTRGLMELIILNIGLQQKIISTSFFTMMVIMAIVTTFMTAPLFKWIHRSGFDEPKPI